MLFKKKKKISNFRLRYKGFLILKDQNKLGLWRELKKQFLYSTPLKNKSNFSKLIFGSTYEFADLIIHQYCVDIFLPNWLGGEILENIAIPKKSRITRPLPSLWVQVLENENFIVNKWIIKLKFSLSVLRKFIHNIRFIFSVIYRSVISRSNKVNNENTVFFCDLTAKNFPPNLNSDYNFDIFSWYIGSIVFNDKIQTIYHSVKEKGDVIYKNVGIKYNFSPTSCINDKLSLLKFIIWSFFSIILCVYDLFCGKWHHALILGEAAKNKVIEMKKVNELSCSYYFPYSSQCYRPIWTYALSMKGIDVVSYFYSTFEQPLAKGKINNQKFEFYLYNWPISLVWNENQSQLLKLNSKFSIKDIIVGPIYDTDALGSVPKNKNFTIAVFDIQAHKKKFHFGVSTLTDYFEFNNNVDLNFLKDIIRISEEFNISVLHKVKRNIGKRSLESYSKYLNVLSENPCYYSIESSISAIKVIDSADLIISAPFTSTAVYGLMRNKPSFYYDPSGWIQKDDPASHGVPIIIGAVDLKRVIQENLLKKVNIN
jgi:polysaccharide biosynthesis PFTS motif protein